MSKTRVANKRIPLYFTTHLNLLLAPRTGWEPGTIASTNSLQAERLEQQKAVLYNNHSYYTSSEYNEAWDRQAIQNSMAFWLDETAKLEHELSVKEENAVEMCSVQNFAEVYILAEHSYSKLRYLLYLFTTIQLVLSSYTIFSFLTFFCVY